MTKSTIYQGIKLYAKFVAFFNGQIICASVKDLKGL